MPERACISIKPARSAQDLESIAHLFEAYAKSLGLDLSFQDFDTELRSLPGKYAPPTGEILLARKIEGAGDAVGCVAVRPLSPPNCCEMKRLYVLPTTRGLGLGKQLLNAILDTAASLGYNEIKLDTLPSMTQAISLYESAGFAQTSPYYDTPHTETVFLARQLETSSVTAEPIDVSKPLANETIVRKTTAVVV